MTRSRFWSDQDNYQEDGPYLDQSKRQGLCLGQGFGQGKDECQSKIQNKGDLIKFNEIV